MAAIRRNHECRLIFLLKRAGKPKARKLKKKAASIPEMGKRNNNVECGARAPASESPQT
jgi:hypothetical protein